MHRVINTFALTFLLLASDQVSAQPEKKLDSLVSGYIGELAGIWDQHRSVTFDQMIYNGESIATQNFHVTNSNPQHGKNELQNNLLVRRNILQQRVYRKDFGLSLGGAYQENLGAPFASVEDVVVFRRKFQVGLDWDLLKGGLLDNRNRIKALQNDLIFMNGGSNGAVAPQSSTLQYYTRVIAFFNLSKIEVLKKRRELINRQNEIAKTLWEMKQLTGDAYLKSIQRRTHISTQYNLYNTYNEDAKKIKGNDTITLNPALFDLDYGKIIRYMDSLKVTNDSFAVYGRPYPKLNSYVNEMSFKAYSRYNYYDVFNNTSVNRNFFSFGVNINAPLTFSSKEKNEIDNINYKLKNYQYNNGIATNESQNTEYFLLNLLYEYRYKLNQYFTLLEKRKQYEELLRTEKVKQKMNDVEFNPNTAIYLLDDYWSNTIELLDLHQQLYGSLLNISEKVPGLDINTAIVPINRDQFTGNVSFNPSRSLYIWSKSFAEHSETFISDYVRLNNFSDLLISYRDESAYLSQLNSFIKNNPSYKIHLMIGQNKLLGKSMQPELDNLKKNIPLKSVSGLHLDIEPQAADDFKEKKEQYFSQYLALLDEAAKFAKQNNLKLSVSIPLNYPQEILTAVFAKCDAVYLMAYENVNTDFITKKTEEEKLAGASKIVLALRAKDFENRDQMEKLFSGLGFLNVAYHDLEAMYDLDKNSIRIKEENKKKDK